jgi:hypothetical protein
LVLISAFGLLVLGDWALPPPRLRLGRRRAWAAACALIALVLTWLSGLAALALALLLAALAFLLLPGRASAVVALLRDAWRSLGAGLGFFRARDEQGKLRLGRLLWRLTLTCAMCAALWFVLLAIKDVLWLLSRPFA